MRGILAIFAVFGLDWETKRRAARLPLRQKREIVKNRLYLLHIKNSGLAYHKCDGKRRAILGGTGALLLLYGGLLFRACIAGEKRIQVPLGLLIGGGLGNFWERLRRGSVTDFLYFPAKGRNMPVFNVADVAIFLGAVRLLWLSVCKNEKI